MSEMKPEDWALVMIIDKLARHNREVPKHDTLLDISGYAAWAHRIRKLDEGKNQSTDDGKNSTS